MKRKIFDDNGVILFMTRTKSLPSDVCDGLIIGVDMDRGREPRKIAELADALNCVVGINVDSIDLEGCFILGFVEGLSDDELAELISREAAKVFWLDNPRMC